MAKMKRIRKPELWWPRLQKLIELRAKAVKAKKKHSHLEAEARMIRTAIIAYELRNDFSGGQSNRKTAPVAPGFATGSCDVERHVMELGSQAQLATQERLLTTKVTP